MQLTFGENSLHEHGTALSKADVNQTGKTYHHVSSFCIYHFSACGGESRTHHVRTILNTTIMVRPALSAIDVFCDCGSAAAARLGRTMINRIPPLSICMRGSILGSAHSASACYAISCTILSRSHPSLWQIILSMQAMAASAALTHVEKSQRGEVRPVADLRRSPRPTTEPDRLCNSLGSLYTTAWSHVKELRRRTSQHDI